MKLSIVTINYNNKEGLKRTFQSVFTQTCKDFEYIVIDGGSNDGSKDLIAENSDEISYWVSEKDCGIYNAMNKGIKVAKGEYLLFLNSGDELHEKITILKCLPQLHKKDLIYGNIEVVKEVRTVKIYPETLDFDYFCFDSLPHPATFIRKSVFKKTGFYDENLMIVSDWKFFLQAVCKYKCTYFHINEIISDFYYDGISSRVENKQKIKQERDKVIQDETDSFLKKLNLLGISKSFEIFAGKILKLLR